LPDIINSIYDGDVVCGCGVGIGNLGRKRNSQQDKEKMMLKRLAQSMIIIVFVLQFIKATI